MNPVRSSLVLLALSAACARAAGPPSDGRKPDSSGATAGPRVEVISKTAQASDGEVQVRFRVVNTTAREITYPGFSEDSPTFSLEFQQGDAWSPYAIGWCGTGLLDFTLAPGAAMSFQVGLPADGKTYRATFGDPKVVTPPVVANAR